MAADFHEEMERSVAAYVLGALDAEEARGVREHIEGCASCREEAARLARVVALVPAATELVTPPDRLRARILAAAGAGQRVESAPTPILRLPRRPGLPFLRRTPSWAAAAMVAAVAAFALGTGIGTQIGRPGPAPAASTSQYTMAGSGRLATAQARVFSLHQDAVMFVDFTGLPQLNQGRVYEVWIIPPGAAPIPAGTFVPDSDGSKVLVLSRTFKGEVTMAVTSEAGPAGSAAPTEAPSMAGKVA